MSRTSEQRPSPPSDPPAGREMTGSRPRVGTRWVTAVPTALWGYASLRALAFAAPAWSEGGRIGLGAIAIAALFFQVVGGRRPRRQQGGQVKAKKNASEGAAAQGGPPGGARASAALVFQGVRRRSRRAWQWLLFLDILSAALLAAAWSTNTGAAVAAPVLALLALGCLVLPSSRGYVDA